MSKMARRGATNTCRQKRLLFFISANVGNHGRYTVALLLSHLSRSAFFLFFILQRRLVHVTLLAGIVLLADSYDMMPPRILPLYFSV